MCLIIYGLIIKLSSIKQDYEGVQWIEAVTPKDNLVGVPFYFSQVYEIVCGDLSSLPNLLPPQPIVWNCFGFKLNLTKATEFNLN